MAQSSYIYFDNNATTAIDPKAFKEMESLFLKGPSNPSSIHKSGQEAKNILAKSRRQAAELLGVYNSEIIFTSGGTEAINLGLEGLLAPLHKGHIISSLVEHKAVLSCLEKKSLNGFSLSSLKPSSTGAISYEQVEKEIKEDTCLIALMAANNETGVVTEDLEKIATLAKEKGIFLFVDAVCAFGKTPLKVHDGITALSIAAHKFHGPKGAGLLFLKEGTDFQSQMLGGSQEYGMRAGTENLEAIVGMIKAMEIATDEHESNTRKLEELRDTFEKGILSIEDVAINGEGKRLPNTSNVYFKDVEGESMLMNLDLQGICVSHGSACTSGALEPSHVLTHMSYPSERVRSSVRFSFSKYNTLEEVEHTLSIIKKIVEALRG